MSFEMHQKKVEALRKKIQSSTGYASLQRLKGHSNTTRSAHYKQNTAKFSTSLDQILLIDPIKQIAIVEPEITMEKLVKATLPHGLLPKVIPEFRGITVGGAITGAALESSSHCYGQFNDICSAYELLLGNGSLIRASGRENQDLFYGISGSYGAMGMLTSVDIDLISVTGFVTLTYRPFNDIKMLLEELNNTISHKNPPDYIEGLVFSLQEGLIIEGRHSSAEDVRVLKRRTTTRFGDQWFAKHARMIKDKGQKECMPLFDYLFRFDRGAFWMGYYALRPSLLIRHFLRNYQWLLKTIKMNRLPPVQNTLQASFLPRALGSAMSSQPLYASLHAIPESWFAKSFVVQDFYIPQDKAKDFVSKAMEEIGIFPIWLCPVKGTETPQFLAPHYCNDALQNFINVGIYGIPRSSKSSIESTRYLEQLLKSIKARKMLYSQTYYSPEEFWEIYSKAQYEQLREKYHAEKRWLSIENKVLTSWDF